MIREAEEKDKEVVNKVATHPLQSWEWGEFRKTTGVKVARYLEVKNQEVVNVFQVTWHKLPGLNKYIGYCPKSVVPSEEVVDYLKSEGKKRGAIMIKFEPNETEEKRGKILEDKPFVAGKPLFTKFTFKLDIDKSEESLLAGMHQKTRYNLRLAEKKGVVIKEDSSLEAFEEYWRLMDETTKRQAFYAHTKSYHQKMFKLMTESGRGHLFTASYGGMTLTAWMVFVLNETAYYPYGASSSQLREVMASNLMMWEIIKFAKKVGCKHLDMWGSLGPVPDPKDPWYGFHKFKQGYGAELIEFLGTYDLVVNRFWYYLYNGAEKVRWFLLRAVKKVLP